MMYDSLEKLSYVARDSFEEIYQSRFHSICTVHLNFSIHDMPAFYVQVPEVSNLIVNIYKITRDIYRDTQLPQVAMNHFSRRCLIDEIVLTNNIEGVNSTRRDITEVLNSIESQKKRRRFKGLVQKYLLLKENSDIDLSTCTNMRHLYDELVLDEVREENPREVPDGQIFRKDSVEVTSSTQKIIHRGLYPESAIIDGMEKALMFLNDLRGQSQILCKVHIG